MNPLPLVIKADIRTTNMRKLFWFLIALSFSFNGTMTYAVEANPADDWTRDEKQMHDALQEARPNATEAEIQEAIGHTLLSANNQWQRAEVHLKRALQLDPKRSTAAYDLGLVFIDSPEGNEYFKKAIAADSTFAAPLYWLGCNAVRSGSDPEAVKFLEKYLKIAQGKEEEGRIKVATAVLEELHSGAPGDEVERLRSKD